MTSKLRPPWSPKELSIIHFWRRRGKSSEGGKLPRSFKISPLQYSMKCLLHRIHHCVTCNPPLGCSKYTTLNASNRAMSYNGSISYLCDANLNGWYRFTGEAGTQMADSCVNMYHCGTESPGWLNGTHPDLNDGAVKRQVCFSSFDNCCHHSSEITVQHCGAFYVYKLERQSHFNLRYCGNGSPYAKGINKKQNKTTSTIVFFHCLKGAFHAFFHEFSKKSYLVFRWNCIFQQNKNSILNTSSF